jgi:cytochrome c-type biogenesis protein CcmE
MKKYGKFAGLIVLVVGILIWLAAQNPAESQTYYKTVPELQKMGEKAYSTRLRVGGDVETGSIQRVGSQTQFVLVQESSKLKVVYTGTEPLPDTFKDGAQALADGRLDRDGVFRAPKIQAKCASKYEAKPGNLMKPGQAPNINNGKSI